MTWSRLLSCLTCILGAGALIACSKVPDSPGDGAHAADRDIGLVTSLPIYWPEAQDMGGLLRPDAPQHWALEALGRYGKIVPLDTLDGAGALPALRRGSVLVLAQPYPLAPQDNVALDDWVRGGGRVLVFADPMLTYDSSYALGDRRRPQDIILLSPILGRWGLELLFDERQPGGERIETVSDIAIPVNLSGQLRAESGSKACTIDRSGLLADCQVGKGRAIVFADAAMLEQPEDESIASRRAALVWLVERFFD